MSKRTLSSYDPRMVEILIKAAARSEPLEIECGDYKKAYAMKFRLMQIKSLMQKEAHPSWPVVSHIGFSTSKEHSKLILRQNDSDLDSILTNALADLEKEGPSPSADPPSLNFGEPDDQNSV